MESIGDILVASENNLKEIGKDINKNGKPSDETLDQANEILKRLNTEANENTEDPMASIINEMINLYQKVLDEYKK